MAIINTRSPHYISVAIANLGVATLTIEVYSGDKTTGFTGTPQYNLSKQVIGATERISFEVAELIKDYVDISFSGDYSTAADTSCKWVRTVLTALDGNGVQLSQTISTDLAFNSYGYFDEGSNFSFEYEGLLMSNIDVIVNSGDSIRIPVFTDRNPTVKFYDSANQVLQTNAYAASDLSEEQVQVESYTGSTAVKATVNYTGSSGSETTTIKITQEQDSKHTPYKVTFINKFGVLQDLFFLKKSVEKMATKRQNYKANTLNSSNTYNTTDHVKRDFNITASESISLSSGFVPESFNEVFKQLMLSERLWMTKKVDNGVTISFYISPVNIKTSSVSYKTQVNDKLIEYTIEFDNSSSVLNDIR